MAKEKSKYPIGKHPNSLEALKKGRSSWKPGQSGNPKGRMPGIKYMSEVLRERLSDEALVNELVNNLIERAKNSDNSITIILERTEGKVTQPIEGQITNDVNFIIGKGYAEDKPDIQGNKQDTG